MYSEKEFVQNKFLSSFQSLKGRKIAIYGISKNTEYILEVAEEYQIEGVLDGYKKSGEIYGSEIISLEKVIEKNIDTIIIVARSNSTKIILNRIRKFCEKNNIEIYDISGVNLIQSANQKTRNFDIRISKAELKDIINFHDVVSFDMFDTLLMRKVLYPQDIYKLVSINMSCQADEIIDFEKYRIEAERELLRSTNPTLEEIYVYIGIITGAKKETLDKYMRAEFELDLKMLVERKDVCAIYRNAAKSGKRVFITTDMYYSASQISQILTKFNLDGYRGLLISSEYKTSKCQNLFFYLKDKIKGQSCVHIGDDIDADIISANNHGVESYQVYSGRTLLEMSAYSDLLNTKDTIDDHVKLGMLVAKCFNSPFALSNSEKLVNIKSVYDLSYLFYAPIITDFTLWFAKQVEKEDALILFSARDGYLLQRLYGILQNVKGIELPKEIYLLTSRMVCIAASMFGRKDILYAANMGFNGEAEDLLISRFKLDRQDVLEPIKGESEIDYVLRHEEKILEQSGCLRNNYCAYLKKLCLKKYKKLIFFDFVSSGTCQMCLEKILQAKMQGIYFLHIQEDVKQKKDLKIDAFLKSGNALEINNPVFDYYFLLESVMTSFEPSIEGMDSSGNPIYLSDARTEAEKAYVKEAQKAIIDYFKEYIKNFGNMDLSDGAIAGQILGLINSQYTAINVPYMESMLLADEFCQRTSKVMSLI